MQEGFRELKKVLNRQAILSAAVVEFQTRGFARTSIGDIMRAAGLGVGTFYNYFGTKEEVLMEIIRDLFGQVDAEIRARDDENSSALDLLETCCMAAAQLIDENRFVLPLLASAVELSDKPEQMPENLSPDFKRIFEEIIRRGQASGEIRSDVPADLISEMLHSIYQAAAFSKLDLPFRENVRLKVKILLDGIENF